MIAFVSLVKVSRILAQAQELLYTTSTRSDTFAKISSLGRLLDQWQASLPEHMRLDFNEMALMTPEEAAADLGRGAPEMVFTQLIWLYARLIVYRPCLSFRQPNDALSASLTHLEYIPREIILLLSLVRIPWNPQKIPLINELAPRIPSPVRYQSWCTCIHALAMRTNVHVRTSRYARQQRPTIRARTLARLRRGSSKLDKENHRAPRVYACTWSRWRGCPCSKSS